MLSATASACRSLDKFAELDELLDFFATAKTFQGLFLFYIFRLLAGMVTDTTDAVDNTRSLDALAETANQIQRIFVVCSCDLDIYHRWKYLTTEAHFGQ